MNYFKTLILIILLSSLYGCKTQAVIPEKPPEYLLQDCIVHGLEGNKIKDALKQSVLNRKSLLDCNADKQSLRRWYSEHDN